MSLEDTVRCHVWTLVEEGEVHEGTYLMFRELHTEGLCFSSSCFSLCKINDSGESIKTSQALFLFLSNYRAFPL